MLVSPWMSSSGAEPIPHLDRYERQLDVGGKCVGGGGGLIGGQWGVALN